MKMKNKNEEPVDEALTGNEPVRYYQRSYSVRTFEDTIVNNRVVKQMKYKTVDPADKFKGLKASDFALENIIAVGAVDSLKECQLNYNSIGETSDNLEGTIDNVISALNDAEAQTPNT